MTRQAVPRLKLLDDEQIAQVHQYSLKILSTVGIRVDSEWAVDLFARAIGKTADQNRVRIPADLVKWAIEAVPHNVTLYDRKGDFAFHLGADHTDDTIFGIGVTNTHFQENETDRIVPFTRKHMELSARLGSALHEFGVISTVGIPSDTPPETSDLYATLDLYANTLKPLVILVADDRCISGIFELITGLHGTMAGKPSLMTYVNPITPLILNEGTVEKITASIHQGIPVIYSNYSMYGATTPVLPSGTLALLNAELLAGLVFCQLIHEGSATVLGSLPASFDMTTMTSPYTPTSFVLNLAIAEMMAYYRIPHCGTSGSGAGWGPDLPAGDMLWMNHLTSCLGKVGLAPFVGGNFESLAFSPATVIYSDQIIRQAREFSAGINLDGISQSLEEILNTGPGGDFLTSGQTLELFDHSAGRRNIWSAMNPEKWQREGHPNASAMLREYARDLMNNLKPPEGYGEIMEKGEALIRRIVK